MISSKVAFPSRPSQPETVSGFFHEIITLWRSLNLVTTEDVMKWADAPRSTVDKWYSGDREPHFSDVRRVAREASRQRGLNDLAAALLDCSFEICPRAAAQTNGSMDDEITDLTIAAGASASAHRAGDVAALDKAISDAESALHRMRAERHLLAGGARP